MSDQELLTDQMEPAGEEPLASEPALEVSPAAETVAEEAVVEEAAAELPAESKQWFIIHTYSGFERKVSESLRTRAEAFGFADKLGQILIPEEEVVELRNGKKVTSKRLLYPEIGRAHV